MFQFSRFAPAHYGFMCRSGRSQGLPHSDIYGSKLVRSSPRLIAAYHVLHRLSAPRHPPDTLTTLDRSHYQYPSSPVPRQRAEESEQASPFTDMIERPVLLQTCPGTCGQATPTAGDARKPILADRSATGTCFLFTMSDIFNAMRKAHRETL